MPDATRALQIRAELENLAPYPDGDTATARSLARWLAMEAQLAWARVMGMDHPVTPADIGIMTGYFAGAHALLAFAEDDGRVGNADEAAVQIREAFEPPGIGEWLFEILGDNAEQIAALADELARVTAPPAAPAGVSVDPEDLRAAVERLPVDGEYMQGVRDRLAAAVKP